MRRTRRRRIASGAWPPEPSLWERMHRAAPPPQPAPPGQRPRCRRQAAPPQPSAAATAPRPSRAGRHAAPHRPRRRRQRPGSQAARGPSRCLRPPLPQPPARWHAARHRRKHITAPRPACPTGTPPPHLPLQNASQRPAPPRIAPRPAARRRPHLLHLPRPQARCAT